MTLGLTIKLRRKALKLTQVQCARRAGMTQSHWGGIESGRVDNPHLETLERIAAVLGCRAGELLGERGE